MYKIPSLPQSTQDLLKQVGHATHFSCFLFQGKTEAFFVVKNNSNKLGDEVYRREATAGTNLKKIEVLSKGKCIVNVVSKFNVILIVTADELYALGSNSYGQIGNGAASGTVVTEPHLTFKAKIIQVGIGERHCVCLTADGQVFAWGVNDNGQLGFPGDNLLQPTKVSITNDSGTQVIVQQIACAALMTFALDESGRVYCWGNVASSVIKQPKMIPTIQDVKNIYCTDQGTIFALTSDGSIYGWGINYLGLLGTGKSDPVLEPLRLVANDKIGIAVDSLVVTSDFVTAKSGRRLFVWGKMAFSAGDINYWSTGHQAITNVKYYQFVNPEEIAADALLPIYLNHFDATPGLISIDSLKKRAENLFSMAFDDPATADFVVVVEGKKIHVHKAILKIRSLHFRTMFATKEWKESRANELPIEHSSYNVYRAFLLYLYSDTFPEDLACEDAFLLMDLVKSYVEHFEADVISLLTGYILSNFVDETSVLETYSLAVDHKVDLIASRCMRYILKNIRKVVKSESFKSLESRHAKTILAEHVDGLRE